MVGLGTIFIAILLLAALQLWRGRLYTCARMLWILMLSVPFPYIANTAGWMTAELGRQPWLIYGLMRTAHGISPQVSAGNAWFTLIGFMGMYSGAGRFCFCFWSTAKSSTDPSLEASLER